MTNSSVSGQMTNEDEISDCLSDETGFCYKGFDLIDDDGAIL